MKKALLLLLALLALAAKPARAQQLVVVQSSRISPYEEALAGFNEAIEGQLPTHGPKQISHDPPITLVLADEPDEATLHRKIQAANPALIVAIGTNALTAVRQYTDIPVVYLMVPYPQAVSIGHANITGVDMTCDPVEQLRALAELLPSLRRLGLIYDPRQSGALVEQIRAATAARHITLVASRAGQAREVGPLLDAMLGTIDAFWMLPDSTVVTPETVEIMLLSSLENRLPILTFSEKYLKRGATLAMVPDNDSMGQQAGELAATILRQPRPAVLPLPVAAKSRTLFNAGVARKLGLNPAPGDPGK